MATVNIGNIKFNWKGAWSNSTTYAVDDVVSHSGSSYISIQAGSNQNPASASAYWQQMSSAGTNGTNGTDLTSTLTTQGDIVYRDGSGLARLGYGTNGQVLTTGGSGANPSWGTVSSDYVKIARYSATGVGASSYNFENIFDASVYSRYHIVGFSRKQSAGGQVRARYLNGSTAYTNSNGYHHGGFDAYRQTNNASNAISSSNDGDGREYIIVKAWGTNSTYGTGFNMTIDGESLANGKYKFSTSYSQGRDDSGTPYVFHTGFGHHTSFTGLVNGIQFYTSDGNGIGEIRLTIYGEKI